MTALTAVQQVAILDLVGVGWRQEDARRVIAPPAHEHHSSAESLTLADAAAAVRGLLTTNPLASDLVAALDAYHLRSLIATLVILVREAYESDPDADYSIAEWLGDLVAADNLALGR